MMQIKLERDRFDPNQGVAKLACVKRIKELACIGLKEAKENVDRTDIKGVSVTIDINGGFNRGDIEHEKLEFKSWGYTLSGGRSEALDDLLGDGYIYTFEYLNRNITYKIESGDYTVTDGLYVIDVEIGTKLDTEGKHSINNKQIKIPVREVSFEKNMLDG